MPSCPGWFHSRRNLPDSHTMRVRLTVLLVGSLLTAIGFSAAWAKAAGPASMPADSDRLAPAARAPESGDRMGAMQRALLQYIYSIPLRTPKPLYLDNLPDPDSKVARNSRVTSPTAPSVPAVNLVPPPPALANGVNPQIGAVPPSSTGLQNSTAPQAQGGNPDSFVENDPPAGAMAGAYGGYDYGAYSRPRRLSTHQREWSTYRYFDGRPGSYGYGHADWGRDDAAGEIYRFGFLRGRDRARFERQSTERQEAVLSHAAGHLSNGLRQFGMGKYQQAADAFILAAESDHGDPTSRIYAGHALFAMGRYHDAVAYMRRAIELQPKIIYLSYDMRDDYGALEDFEQQLAELVGAVELAPREKDRLVMLGYVQYYTGQRREAFNTLLRAARLDPTDRLIERFMNNCQPPDVEAAQMRQVSETAPTPRPQKRVR